jgi:hypothetical protein
MGKPEYATPMKHNSAVHRRSTNDEKIRSFSFCKPIHDIDDQVRPLSMFNWLQYGLSNPMPSTFQPSTHSTIDAIYHGKSLVKENIYASEIDVHLPYVDEKDYLSNSNPMIDYFSSDKCSSKQPSMFQDLSRLFSRLAHQQRNEKIKRRNKLEKHTNNLRCSIM